MTFIALYKKINKNKLSGEVTFTENSRRYFVHDTTEIYYLRMIVPLA